MFGGWPSSAACFSDAPAEHLLWGAGNKKGGVHVAGGSVLCYPRNVPKVTGMRPGVDDFLAAGAATGRAFNEATGLPTTPKIPNSWERLSAPIVPLNPPPVGEPGFGGNAHNFERDAHIVLRDQPA